MRLSAALDDLYAGDLAGLERRLRADPALVHARVPGAGPHYEGYFHEATLLHHVAGNPTIRPLPAQIVDVARLLLDLGAEIDALTHAGPCQPDDIGWTTLGLAATSAAAREHGVQRALLELLVERGADVDHPQGGPLIGALYYDEQDAARWLLERGARVDLIAAAGLGRVDLMERLIDTPDAHTLIHYARKSPRPTERTDVLGLALLYAANGGHLDAARWLIEHGAEARPRPPFHDGVTPLHGAALRGHEALVELLIAHGADLTARDGNFDSTPAGWATHAGHVALAARLSS
jgi:hypothetical protein